jgi:hypothetical protein
MIDELERIWKEAVSTRSKKNPRIFLEGKMHENPSFMKTFVAAETHKSRSTCSVASTRWAIS